MDGTLETILGLLRQHAGETYYRALLERLQRATQEELARLYAAVLPWCGQPAGPEAAS